jgi:transposase-like protein
MPAGRPTKYNPEMQAAADRFIDEFDGPIISLAAMSLALGVAKSTLEKWGKEHEEFSGTIKRLNATQEAKAVQDGFTGAANPTIVKLLLANHGYHERKQVDNVSSDGSMTPHATSTEVLEALKRKHAPE